MGIPQKDGVYNGKSHRSKWMMTGGTPMTSRKPPFPNEKKNTHLVGGWATPLKNMKVNWDDDIPNIWENKKWQPNHQPDNYIYIVHILWDF